MVSIQLKYPRSSLPVNILKLVSVLLVIVVGGPFLAAVSHVLLGIGETTSVVGTVAILLPGVVLFMMSEDRDFDWNTYRAEKTYLLDGVAVVSASILGTTFGYRLADGVVGISPIQLATLFGIVAAYETFVYLNRDMFPLHVLPWFGGVYVRVRMDE